MDKLKYTKDIIEKLEKWAKYGETVNAAGTRLIGHMPHIAPKAYQHIIYSPMDLHLVQEVTPQLGRALPEQYKQFLSFANGMLLFAGDIRVFGFVPIKCDFEKHIHNYPPDIVVRNVSGRIKGLSKNAVLVGFYQEDGSYVSLEADGSAIRFDAADSGGIIQKWEDFDTWLFSEIDRMTQQKYLPS